MISHVLKIIAAVHPVQNPASHEFIEQAIRDNIAASLTDLPTTPVYFEYCQLESIDWENKTVQLIFPNWPTAIVADGCSVNVKAGKDITKNLGLMSPTASCASHTSDGSIK